MTMLAAPMIDQSLPSSTSDSPASSALELVCAEIWGGNRPIHRPVELPGLRGMLYSSPSDGGRGGDVHYLSVCGSGLLSRMCVADVVGHGAAVATVSDEMHALLRRLMNQPDQRRVLGGLNQRLDRLGLKAMTTAAAVTYYPPSGKVSVSYAGHPPAWYWRASEGRWLRLELDKPASDAAGMWDLPLAVDPQAKYSRRMLRAAIGDRLVLVTDGVLEAPGATGELYGEERLAQLLARHSGEGPAVLSDRILDDLRKHVGRAEFEHDDVTFLAVEVVPGPRGPAVWHAVKNRIVRRRGNADTATR